MSGQLVKVMVPQTVASPRGARWAAAAALGSCGLLGATRDAWIALIAARALRSVQQGLRRLTANGVPETADELLAYAQHIERDMPGLAADLRAAALRHQALAE